MRRTRGSGGNDGESPLGRAPWPPAATEEWVRPRVQAFVLDRYGFYPARIGADTVTPPGRPRYHILEGHSLATPFASRKA